MRLHYLMGYLFLGLCAWAFSRLSGRSVSDEPGYDQPIVYTGPAAAWFQSVRPGCNALEVELRHRMSPPPVGTDGAGYSAACWALAGRISEAAAAIEALPAGQQATAAGMVFAVGHPVADMGDDLSAGPIMDLVVRYQPANYMALYHAGMSAYATDRPDVAVDHLQRFLTIYGADDGWRRNAVLVLGRLGVTP